MIFDVSIKTMLEKRRIQCLLGLRRENSGTGVTLEKKFFPGCIGESLDLDEILEWMI